jgi:hypothetical protein
MLQRAEVAGQELAWAPLSEVADHSFEGIRDGTFWIAQPPGDEPTPGSAASALLRARSQFDRSAPEYLVQAPNVMTGRKAGARD